jgi:formate dehydrogenase major subunit
VLTKEERRLNFKEVELGLSEEQAKREAARCLACGCADADVCKLRKYATTYDADQFAFSGELKTHPIDKSHKYIIRDKNKCILCGRCMRICLEAGYGVLGFVGRGFDRKVEPSYSVPLGEDKKCIDCGLCVSTCPTGALQPREGVTLPTTAYTDREEFDELTSIADAVAQAKKASA